MLLGLVLAVATRDRPRLDGEAGRHDARRGRAGDHASTSTPTSLWILAVGSDARPGEEMTRTRGDALQLVGHQHQDRCGDGDRHPPRLLRRHPRPRQRPGQRRPLLRRPAAARRDRRQPDRDPARVRLRDRLQDVPEDDQQHRRRLRPQPRRVQRPLPQGSRASRAGRIRLGGYTALAYARVRKGLDRRRLRPLRQPAADPARHPRQDPREGRQPRLPRARTC